MIDVKRGPVRGPLAALLLGFSGLVFAHGGEDHSPAEPALVVSGAVLANDAPARLADGSVFLPKATQRQIGVRTQLAQPAAHALTLELKAH